MNPVPNPSPNPRAWQFVWWSLGIALFALFFVRTWKSGGNDFIAYYEAGARAIRGESPYRTEATPFRYLPVTAFFFTPLSWFDFKSARLLFFVLNFFAATVIYSSIRKNIGDLSTLVLLAFFFRFHNHDFQNAQINSILLLLFLYWWDRREDKSKLRSAGLAFSVFASFKLVPFVIGLPLLLLRRGKEILWIGAWTLGLNLLPALFYDAGLDIFGEWFAQAKTIEYPAAMLPNVQALQSALWWQLQGSLPAHTFAFAMHLIQVGLIFGCWYLCPSPRNSSEKWILAGSLATSVLISPLAWKHNYVQFLPLMYLVVRYDPGIKRRATRGILAFGFLGMVAAPSLIASLNREFSDRLYLMVWSGLGLILAALRYSRSKSEV